MGIEFVSQPRMMVPPPPVTLWNSWFSFPWLSFPLENWKFLWFLQDFSSPQWIPLSIAKVWYWWGCNQASLNKGTKNDYLIYEHTAETAHPRLCRLFLFQAHDSWYFMIIILYSGTVTTILPYFHLLQKVVMKPTIAQPQIVKQPKEVWQTQWFLHALNFGLK